MGKVILIGIFCAFAIKDNSYGQAKRKKLDVCYSGTYTGIDTLINCKGYYIINMGFFNSRTSSYTYDQRLCVFYNDGLFLLISSAQPFEIIETGTIEQLSQMFNHKWGTYHIEDDIIKAQTLDIPESSIRFSIGSLWFKIIDINTIEFIDIYTKSKNIQNKYNINFLPSGKLPDPSLSWALKRKWFWCDEKAYKEWKRARKDP